MILYRFRVYYEEDDSVFRDIDVIPSQTFADFEATIISAYNLPVDGSGIFFQSNDNWQKGKLIFPRKDMQPQKKGARKATAIPSIASFIDDPHQHFIYEFNGIAQFVFLIELSRIGSSGVPATDYPLMVKTQGPSPYKKDSPPVQSSNKKKTIVPMDPASEVIADEDEDKEDDKDDEEDIRHKERNEYKGNDDEADEEDLAVIEGEEGEAGDLMEGDAIKEEEDGDELGGDDFDEGMDFDPEENAGDGDEEDY